MVDSLLYTPHYSLTSFVHIYSTTPLFFLFGNLHLPRQLLVYLSQLVSFHKGPGLFSTVHSFSSIVLFPPNLQIKGRRTGGYMPWDISESKKKNPVFRMLSVTVLHVRQSLSRAGCTA